MTAKTLANPPRPGGRSSAGSQARQLLRSGFGQPIARRPVDFLSRLARAQEDADRADQLLKCAEEQIPKRLETPGRRRMSRQSACKSVDEAATHLRLALRFASEYLKAGLGIHEAGRRCDLDRRPNGVRSFVVSWTTRLPMIPDHCPVFCGGAPKSSRRAEIGGDLLNRRKRRGAVPVLTAIGNGPTG